ncbi:kinase-like domain-containing protein [Paraphoma chrysanthemicola]|uniref:Kinase-like domain-containing protein n=1 Tax=Paraphoma chrysanthemicola TaxID=798071 RepID=A0A8K0R7N7_9PLEO|nr:kinase-like domain-containing protein [Paraphoma chrysanthemicola]
MPALERLISSDIYTYCRNSRTLGSGHAPADVLSSKWLKFLDERGILVGPEEELNWSGKGQHVEYGPEDETIIPLKSEKILGHSHTAIIDSVRCRRIRLARKKIACNRRLKKEEAIAEVEHLTKLQHSHIVRVVGTYTFKKDLAILLYPATECDLDAYMDEITTVNHAGEPLSTFFGCLSRALCFIHKNNVKHMDIKPKNILVRVRPQGVKVYIADFGIARSYKFAADSETDSPISLTRAYAAPEVVMQDKRGFSADIFSLGCVFAEMSATMYSCMCGQDDERQKLLDIRKANSGTSSFYTNVGVVEQWFAELYGIDGRARIKLRGSALEWLLDLFPSMLSLNPDIRPSAQMLQEGTALLRCSSCENGPDAFEAADPVGRQST